jgi:hypothetical protein
VAKKHKKLESHLIEGAEAIEMKHDKAFMLKVRWIQRETPNTELPHSSHTREESQRDYCIDALGGGGRYGKDQEKLDQNLNHLANMGTHQCGKRLNHGALPHGGAHH